MLMALLACATFAAAQNPVLIIAADGEYDATRGPLVQIQCFDLALIGPGLTIPPCLPGYQVLRSSISGGPYAPVASCVADGFMGSAAVPNAYFTPCLDSSAGWGGVYFFRIVLAGVQSSEIAVILPLAPGTPAVPVIVSAVAQ